MPPPRKPIAEDHIHRSNDIYAPGEGDVDSIEEVGLGGPGGAASLEAVLAEGNETGESTIVMPMGTIYGTTANAELSIAGVEATGSGNGGRITISSGNQFDVGSNGSYVRLTGGQNTGLGGSVGVVGGDAAFGSGQNGGDVTVIPGAGDGAGENGQVILGGTLDTGENTIVMPTGTLDGVVDSVKLGGSNGVVSTGAMVEVFPGDSVDPGAGGEVFLTGGNGADSYGGSAYLTAGNGDGLGNTGGDVRIAAGGATGGGTNGRVMVTRGLVFLNLPTANPAVAGALWSDSGVVKVSAG